MAADQVVCPFFGVVFERLKNLIYKAQKKLGPLVGLVKELKKLLKTFFKIKEVLSDAEEKQFNKEEEAVRFWLQELNDAAYEADDVFDEFEYETLKQLASEEASSSDNNETEQLYAEVQKLIEMFHGLAEECLGLDLQKGKEKRVVVSPFRRTISSLTEPRVYGRDEDREKLVKQLLGSAYVPLEQYRAARYHHPKGGSGKPVLKNASSSSSSQDNISVVPILGMGGLGKTTLAQMVYNDERVQDHFSDRSWVCVSDHFDIKRLMKAIIATISRNECNLEDLELLQQHLQVVVHGKKFLLVLDDVWEERQEEWNKLKSSFRGGTQGSSVIVTTRLPTVASITSKLPPYCLNILSEEHCWALFKQYAFRPGNEKMPALVDIGKRIMKKCGGLPLAAKALGGLLRFKDDENEWLSIENSAIWDFENDILPALGLSYYHLPSTLKQCFVYCSIFPKDYKIQKEQLIQLWMANGLVQSRAKIELEDVANEIFNALLWRSFFQEVEKDEYGNIIWCKMHDLVHDLASYFAGDKYFVEDVESARNITKRIRHVTVLCKSGVPPSSILESMRRSSPCLRSLIRLTDYEVTMKCEFFSNFIRLRALDLHSSGIEVVPDGIGEMIHLRYLNLSSNHGITSLPETICLLRNLQTLKLERCWELMSLPKDMRKMSSLRHLNIRGCGELKNMPVGMGQLFCLQTLSIFIVGMESGRRLNELQDLNLRGELMIKGLEHVKTSTEAEAAKLVRKKNLHSLRLKWSSDSEFQLHKQQQQQQQQNVIEGLQPHVNVRELCVEGYVGVTWSPSWLKTSLVPNLAEISVSYCTCEHLGSLRKLPRLKVLKLLEMDSLKFIEVDDESAGGFPSLEKLVLCDMPNLEVWSWSSLSSSQTAAEIAVFPCLRKVIIRACPKLKGVPLSWSPVQHVEIFKGCNEMVLASLRELPCLSSLDISGVYELEYFPQGTLNNLPALQKLTVEHCHNLKALPVELNNLATLTELEIYGCEKMVSLVDGEGGLRNLSSLKTLVIDNCKALKRLPELKMTSLITLRITYCSQMEFLKEDFDHLVVLEELKLFELPKLTCFPEGIKHCATTLQHLEFCGCVEYGMMDLPDWIGTLTSLEYLVIHAPKKWKVLPQWMEHLTALKRLIVHGCNEELVEQWENRNERREDYCFNMISHVPHVCLSSDYNNNHYTPSFMYIHKLALETMLNTDLV